MSSVRATRAPRAPRVSFVTRESDTADGFYNFKTKIASEGTPLGSSSNVQQVVLAQRAETTVFGKFFILPAGARIFVKKINKDRVSRKASLQYNTPQWEATFQNVAWQHGLAPRVYGYDNKSRVITMAPCDRTLASFFEGPDKKFSEEMQLKYIELVHRLDKIGIVHGDLVPENIMLDAYGNMVAIDFERARQITETETQRSGGHVNLLSCMQLWDNSVRIINFKYKEEEDIIAHVLERVQKNPKYDVDKYIQRKRTLLRFLRDTSTADTTTEEY